MRRSADNMGCGLAGKMGFLAGCAFALVTLLGATSAVAELIMAVNATASCSDSGTPDDPNDDITTITYSVTNDPNNTVSIDKFVIPATGVPYTFNCPSGWGQDPNDPNKITFIATGNYINPSETKDFTVVANTPYTGKLNAVAYSGNEAFTPVVTTVPVPEKTLSADLDGDGVVNMSDYALLLRDMGKRWENRQTTLSHYEDTQSGIKLISDVFYDADTGWNIFDYYVQNGSGDTLFQIKFIGEGWQYGSGQSWTKEIIDSAIPNQDTIRFYDNLLDKGRSEEFITGSNVTNTWGIRDMEFKSDAGNTFYLKGLAPEVPEPKLPSDLNNDNVVDIKDLAELAKQWLNMEIWYQPL